MTARRPTLQPGTKFRWRGDLTHVVTRFEDDGQTFIVVKAWGRRRQRWLYSVEPLWLVEGVLAAAKVNA